MVKVRTTDTYFAMEIQEEATYGTNPTWPGSAVQIPFIEDTLKFEDQEFADTGEFGAKGAWTGVEKGLRIISGTIKVKPRYNEAWFWLLFCQGFGSEDIVLDRAIDDDTTVATNLNTHVMSNLGIVTTKGLSARTFLQGPTNGAGTSIKRINGLICNKWTWEQPAGAEPPTLTMEWLGSVIAMDSGSGVSPVALSTTDIKVKGFDLDSTRAKSFLHFGNTGALASLNTSSFTLSMDRGIETAEEYLQNALNLSKPGQEVTRELTLDLEGFLEQDFHAANKPHKEYFDDTPTRASIAYESATDAIAGEPYAIRFDIPNLHWRSFNYDITEGLEGAVPITASGRMADGDIDDFEAASDQIQHNAIGTLAGVTDFRCLAHVNGTDDSDAKFSAVSNAP